MTAKRNHDTSISKRHFNPCLIVELSRNTNSADHTHGTPYGHATVFEPECKRGPRLDFHLRHAKTLDFDASMIMNIRMVPKRNGDTTWSDRTNWEADGIGATEAPFTINI